MVGTKRGSRPDGKSGSNPVQPDLDFVLSILDDIFEIIMHFPGQVVSIGPGNLPSPYLVSSHGSSLIVLDVIAGLGRSWERNPGLSLNTPVKDINAAADFLIQYATPLLSPENLKDEFTIGDVFLKWQDATRSSTLSLTLIPFVEDLLNAYRAMDDEVLRGVNTSFQADTALSIMRFISGISVLTSLPVWTFYHNFHGTATVSRILDIAHTCFSVAKQLLGNLPPEILRESASGPDQSTYNIAQIVSVIAGTLSRKVNALETFRKDLAKLPKRTVMPEADLNSRIQRTQLWVDPKKIKAGLGNAPPDSSTLASIAGTRLIFWASGKPTPRETIARSYFALKDPWEMLIHAGRLVNQAGFSLLLTAANNEFGGRHPPHQTHRSGTNFDMIWTFTNDDPFKSSNVISELPPLAKSKKPTDSGLQFIDPVTSEVFFLTGATHSGIEKLSTWVVLQALPLAGLGRYLYADFPNMFVAAKNLGFGVDLDLRQGYRKGDNIPVFEGLGHYNHLHAEALVNNAQGVAPFINQTTLSQIYRLALQRDKDKNFTDNFFSPPDEATNKTKQLVDSFTKEWFKRSSNGTPSLLPVWVPSPGS